MCCWYMFRHFTVYLVVSYLVISQCTMLYTLYDIISSSIYKSLCILNGSGILMHLVNSRKLLPGIKSQIGYRNNFASISVPSAVRYQAAQATVPSGHWLCCLHSPACLMPYLWKLCTEELSMTPVNLWAFAAKAVRRAWTQPHPLTSSDFLVMCRRRNTNKALYFRTENVNCKEQKADSILYLIS